ncbi:hypothetical protein DVH24_015760 [Malus domestica]|uniref:SSD domain-containing protein n=1 Tax=Malus domestica TaxID=3750 RepID=A0A498HHZ1_MALDO|nr:hypothetical protein DVH24_015760 [Malus domestica]
MFAYISLTLGDSPRLSSFYISSKVLLGLSGVVLVMLCLVEVVEVGPSITLASLSEVLAFALTSFIPMSACRVFSMFAALAVLLDFLLQVTAFVALIVFYFWKTEG